jgi:hypothetical protein
MFAWEWFSFPEKIRLLLPKPSEEKTAKILRACGYVKL